VTSFGTPVVLQIDQPTFVDAQSAIAWSHGVNVELNSQFKMGNLIGRSSGESSQLALSGNGFVVVQASEGPVVVEHEHPHNH
jgi:uncharacterized protein (AIM24 family)